MSANNILPVNPYSQIYSKPNSSRSENKSEAAKFSELLISMFSGSFGDSIGSGFGENSESGSSSSGLNSMMMPIMLSLLEKLQSLDVESAAGTAAVSTKMPVEAGQVTQEYNANHHALDFGVVEGTLVKSTMSGKVVHSGWNDQGYGNLVIVENGNRRTYYAHLSELPVTTGEWVNEGDVIGLSGNTGNSTGPHLHYEVRVNGLAVDPSDEVFGSNKTVV